MIGHWFVGCWLAAALLWPIPATADTLYLNDGNVIFGRVLSTNAESVLFNERLKNGEGYRQRNFERSTINTLVVNIHPEELSQVDPTQPESYYEIAEILDPQKRDPEARDLAIRLYLLAAEYGSPSLRNTCLRKIIPLARGPWEQKKFYALANRYLTDGVFEMPTISQNESETTTPSDEETQRLRELRNALEALRTDNRSEAADIINQKWVDQVLEPFLYVCSYRELRQWSIAPELKTEWLARTLELELKIEAALKPRRRNENRGYNWSRLADQKVQLLSPISLRNATDFDLSKNKFREGVWVTDPEE